MKIINRKFSRKFKSIEEYEAGIELLGSEVKSVRAGRMLLDDSFVKIINNEAYLINAEISVYKFARPHEYDSKKTRKLLLHKKELIRLKTKISSSPGLTIAPIGCYNKGNLIKLKIALVKGKGDIERKKQEKKQDIIREEKREMKEYLKS